MDSSQWQATRERDSATLYWPSNMGRVLLLALQDAIDAHDLNAVLDSAELHRHAGDPPRDRSDPRLSNLDISHVMRALEERYGAARAGRLSAQIGRAGFRRARAEFGALFGLADLDRRLLPLRIKLGVALDALTSALNDSAGQEIRVDSQANRLICTVEHCPLCLHHHTDSPCCHAALGLLQEMIAWVGGSTRYRVQETACIAAGATACRFVIDARPPSTDLARACEARP